MSFQAYAMRQFMRLTLKRKTLDTVEAMREMVAAAKSTNHPAVAIQPITILGLQAEWLIAPDSLAQSVILYLHGGGYVSGSLDSHRGAATLLAYESRIPVLLLDYRLAPEHPYPAALEDSTDMYQWLLDRGYKPENILLAGDSAGGGLTLATLLYLRDQKMPLPAGAMCLSPWTDLMGTGESVETVAEKDPWLKPSDINVPVRNYLQGQPADQPYVSPLYADLHDLPPIMIQVGEYEILRSDSERFTEKARQAGVDVQLQVWSKMWHVWQLFYDVVPESKQAMRVLAMFANERIGKPSVERTTVSFMTYDLRLVQSA